MIVNARGGAPTQHCANARKQFTQFARLGKIIVGAKFKSKDTVVLPVSVDSTPTHNEFRAKHGMKHNLLSDFKREVGWLHERAGELMEFLMLPVLHVAAALLNFAMILVVGKPVFGIPFKSLKDVVETRELLPAVKWQPKKVAS